MRQATIRDVAARAKVSVASVSRALNGHENVHPETRQRVMAAVEALHYVPNAAARSLSTALTHSIGVVVPDLHGEFFSELIRGMDEAAGEAGYLLLLSTMHADPALAGQAINAMRGRVDGLILMAPQLPPALLDRLVPAGMATVQVNTPENAQRTTIGIDNAAGARAVADHLVAAGRRRPLHIAGPVGNFDASERREAFAEHLHAQGITPVECTGAFDDSSGARLVGEMIDRGVPFDCIFAANDMMAIGAMQELRARGIDVPGKVAVVGFDDVPLAQYLGLTTVAVHVADIGRRAVQALVASFGERPPPPRFIKLAPSLMVRASSECS
ncbi:LacI family DNA-binding transcriptional regulator [Sphingomonas sp. ASV193]|uniref:LacI family DNA-binding transcriptional regulator n=1 Tax=Sphingomonas sp. ASV193 TaxID=3144405 RepID=UPI0032E88C8E